MANPTVLRALAATLKGGVQGYQAREERELDRQYKQASLDAQLPEMISPELYNPMVAGSQYPEISEPISLSKAKFVQGAKNQSDRNKRETDEYKYYRNLYASKDSKLDSEIRQSFSQSSSLFTDPKAKDEWMKQLNYLRKQKLQNNRKFKEVTGNFLFDQNEFEREFLQQIDEAADTVGGAAPGAARPIPAAELLINMFKRK